MSTEKKDLNIRSEKVRDIVGEIPSTIMRYGLYVIFLFITLIFVCLYTIPVYEQYTTNVIIKSIPESNILSAHIDGQINYFINDNYDIKIDDKIGRIVNSDTTYIIYSKTSGKIVLNQKDKTQIVKDDILCKIKPNHIQYFYGEILVPISFINKDYNSFDVEIITHEGSTIKGKITHIYEILVNEGSNQLYKANISIDNKDYLPTNLVCKTIITINKERLINKIFK